MASAPIWKELTVRAIITGVLSLIVSALVASAFSAFRAGLGSYDRVVLGLSGALFAALFSYELVTHRANARALYSITGAYMLAFASFFVATVWARAPVLEQHLPLVLGFAFLILGRLAIHIGDFATVNRERRERQSMGYAVTSVLISDAVPEEPQFILVFNRNLRAGKGLWVPPGGHFTPYRDDPEDSLVARVKAEVALDCRVLNTSEHSLPSAADDLRTEACRWLIPPAFLLREAMFGLCSYLHSSHLDLVYLCMTSGTGVGGSPKYDLSQRVTVPVRSCAGSIEEAERAASRAIDAWYKSRAGAIPGRREDLTRDVCWRLHLAARIYLERQPTAAAGERH